MRASRRGGRWFESTAANHCLARFVVADLINDIKPAAEIVRTLIREAQGVLGGPDAAYGKRE
jgi:hypothetical protein